MQDTQPLTKADFQEFAKLIKQEISDFRSEVNLKFDGINSEISSVKNELGELKMEMREGFKSVREDIDAIASDITRHEELIPELKARPA